MNKLLDRLVLFVLCMAVYLMHEHGGYIVIPVLIAILAASVCTYFVNELHKLAVFSIYIGGCVFLPQLLYFLPELCYALPKKRWRWLFLAAVPLFITFMNGNIYIAIYSILLTGVGYLMSYRATAIEQSRREYIELRDSAKELSIKLENKNRALMQSQDYEVNMATLRERNRIARDIHDGVGHLLSSAILQVGAIMATGKDPAEKERLETVKGTLKEAMDSIRTSVHNLYDDSVDLYPVLRSIVDSYTFCPVTLDCQVTQSPDKKLQYAFIAIVKEALSNTAKHSGATAVAITLHEQPRFYSLIVSDNGHGFGGSKEPDGIGLKSIAERVENVGGILTINGEKGFKIFISVPKERADG